MLERLEVHKRELKVVDTNRGWWKYGGRLREMTGPKGSEEVGEGAVIFGLVGDQLDGRGRGRQQRRRR